MSEVRTTGEGMLAILEAVAALSKVEVLVGVPHGEARSDAEGLSNAQIGYLLETGSPAMNLEPRPHLVPGIEAVQDIIGQQLAKAVDAALNGNQQRMYFYLNTAGMKATMSVKNLINAGDFAPLKPLTILQRQRRGRKSIKPLVDTGQYRNAHTYVIIDGDREVNSGNS